MYMLQHYIPLFIHILSLVIGFGGVIVVDTFGLLWLLKKIPLKTVTNTAEITQRLIWIGWFGLVISGSVLLYQQGTIRDLTWIKLFLVAMLGANGIFLHFIKKSMERLGDVEVIPKVIMFRTSLASTISQLGWWGAMIIGFMNTNTHYRVSLPFSPALVMIVILLGISIAAIVGEIVLRKKDLSIDSATKYN
jgi:hypothetical protein